MERWINVDWDNRVIEKESFVSKRDAWGAACQLSTSKGRSAYEWDQVEIEVEAG